MMNFMNLYQNTFDESDALRHDDTKKVVARKKKDAKKKSETHKKGTSGERTEFLYSSILIESNSPISDGGW